MCSFKIRSACSLSILGINWLLKHLGELKDRLPNSSVQASISPSVATIADRGSKIPQLFQALLDPRFLGTPKSLSQASQAVRSTSLSDE